MRLEYVLIDVLLMLLFLGAAFFLGRVVFAVLFPSLSKLLDVLCLRWLTFSCRRRPGCEVWWMDKIVLSALDVVPLVFFGLVVAVIVLVFCAATGF